MENIFVNETILKLFPNGEVWKFGYKKHNSKEPTWHPLVGCIMINKETKYKSHHTGINGKSYITARLLAYAFLRFDLEETEDTIDHIKCNQSTNNNISNLRCASRSEQILNRSRNINAIGWMQTPSGRYRAQININYKYKHLGTYDTSEEAHNAYLEAVKSRL